MKTGPKSNPELAAEIGRRVVRRRDFLGLTQREVAAEVGFAREMVTYIEKGHCFPTAPHVTGLCRALKMSPNELFGWPEDAC